MSTKNQMKALLAAIRSADRKPVKRKARQKPKLNVRTGGFMGLEKKFLDASRSAAVVQGGSEAGLEADPATLLGLNSVAQGDGESERDGRKIDCDSIMVNGTITDNAQADQNDQFAGQTYMVALVLDKQTNGAQLNSEDVFTNPGSSVLTSSQPYRNLQFASRFEVLDSVVLVMPQRTAFTDGSSTGTISGFEIPFKLRSSKKFKTTFSGTTGVIANITDNSLHVIASTSDVGGSPNINYTSRLRFFG